MTAASATPPVAVQNCGSIVHITVGDGSKRNALTSRGWDAIADSVRGSDRDGTHAIVIRGSGGMFCAGSDLREWVEADLDVVEDSFARMESAFRTIEQCSVPVIAEVHGTAAGAGCQLALACDMRFLANSARIGMPIARLGIKASPAFAARILSLAGPATTRHMLYTGVLYDASEAVRRGLADQRVPDDDLPAVTAQVLSRIAEKPAATLRAAKHAVSQALAPTRQATTGNSDTMIEPAEFHDRITRFLG